MLFGVFDGHGGAEVAKLCGARFAEELMQLSQFEHGQFDEALRRAFHRMDEQIMAGVYTTEIDRYVGESKIADRETRRRTSLARTNIQCA